jgi:phosphomannomutase
MRTHYIFDVDGTLTPSRQKMDKDFSRFFLHFCTMNSVYLVTGSDREKTLEQVGSLLYKTCKRVYNCSGSDVYVGSRNVYRDTWTLPVLARQFLEQCMEEEDFSIRTGNHIEERPGMINYSLIGRNATMRERKAFVEWESWNGSRRRTADAFNIMFPELQATIGGETGIDIGPKGSDKSQILRDFYRKSDKIIFFGDAIFEGGNDLSLANAIADKELGMFYKVTEWKETWKILK